MTLADVLRTLASGGLQGGPCRDTDPQLDLASGLPCGPAGAPEGAIPDYVQRTIARRVAMQALDDLCFWHLLLIEIPADVRVITAARRALHIRLRNAQAEDDQAVVKTAEGG